jgi:glycosyltransferase involved in cell wall biosynthesis
MSMTSQVVTRGVPRAARKKLLVCIPAYNEAENIGTILDNLLQLPMKEKFDVLVVDDGSVDDTCTICEYKNVMVITHLYNMGYGATLKTAYRYAADNKYDYVIQMDADGQHDVKNIERLYSALTESGEFSPDIVIGSRFLQDSVSFHVPIHKRIVIAVFNIIIKLTTQDTITDPTSGLQGLNRHAFGYYSKFNNFAIDYPDANMIIQMAMNDFTINEVPAIMHARTKGESMHSGFYKPIKYMINMTLSVLGVCIRESSKAKKKKRAQ